MRMRALLQARMAMQHAVAPGVRACADQDMARVVAMLQVSNLSSL